MSINFPFKKNFSPIFGTVYRPIAVISFWSKAISNWVEIPMVVDTGADYTLLPHYWSDNLHINLKKDCRSYISEGIGGRETVYLLKNWRVKIDSREMKIPVGFLNHDNIPPLLGRQNFLEKLKLTMEKHVTRFG